MLNFVPEVLPTQTTPGLGTFPKIDADQDNVKDINNVIPIYVGGQTRIGFTQAETNSGGIGDVDEVSDRCTDTQLPAL